MPYWVDEWAVGFDFGSYRFPCRRFVPPRQAVTLGQRVLLFPSSVVGTRRFDVSLRAYPASRPISSPGIEWRTEMGYYLNLWPTPRYRVFVSRSFALTDEHIAAPFLQALKRWGLDPIRWAPNAVAPAAVPYAVRDYIAQADAVVVIAVPGISMPSPGSGARSTGSTEKPALPSASTNLCSFCGKPMWSFRGYRGTWRRPVRSQRCPSIRGTWRPRWRSWSSGSRPSGRRLPKSRWHVQTARQAGAAWWPFGIVLAAGAAVVGAVLVEQVVGARRPNADALAVPEPPARFPLLTSSGGPR
jgi:hypothetical protein